MRITNMMSANKMLLNITKNTNRVDKLYTQLATGKKIQLASEDPIIASRALKFRTAYSDTSQYIRNTEQGMAWMETTSQGFTNLEATMANIRERLVQGASDTYDFNDRQKLASEIQAYYNQIGSELNISYAGSYVFSGYRTDKPPTLLANDAALSYTGIEQSFKPADIENTTAYTKVDADSPVVTTVNRIKLAYTGADLPAFTPPFPAPITVTEMNMSIDPDRRIAYNPGANDVYYIRETGELILGSGAMTEINNNPTTPITVQYDKTGFAAGDLNPEIYFTCTDSNGKTFTMDNQNLQYEFGINTRITINSLAKDSYTAQLHSDLRNLLNLVNGIAITPDAQLRDKYSSAPYNLSGDELNKAIADQIGDETKKYRGVLHDAYSSMLKLVDGHISTVSREETQLGSRMNRIELIQNRLTEDRLSFYSLMSDNEDADYAEVSMYLATAEYVYTASLKAGSSIIQQSLVDFIR